MSRRFPIRVRFLNAMTGTDHDCRNTRTISRLLRSLLQEETKSLALGTLGVRSHGPIYKAIINAGPGPDWCLAAVVTASRPGGVAPQFRHCLEHSPEVSIYRL